MFAAGAQGAEPYRPSKDSEVLEVLPDPGPGTRRELRLLRTSLAAAPDDQSLALRLARRYLALGRSRSDPRFYGYAEAALAPWWHQARPPIEVRLLRAVVRQSRHDFRAALQDLEGVLAQRPDHGQAGLSRAFVLMAMGRIDEAAAGCRALPRATSALAKAVCNGRADSLQGRTRSGYRRLQDSLSRATAAEPPLRLWALTALGEMAAQLGRPRAAETHFREALTLDGEDVYLLAAYADLLLDRGRNGEARKLLTEGGRNDALLLRRAIAGARLRDADAARDIAALKARFAASRRRGDQRHLREEARFALQVLDRPENALSLALANWRHQREPWDARLVLESALAAGQTEKAKPVLDWMAATGAGPEGLRDLATRLAGEKG